MATIPVVAGIHALIDLKNTGTGLRKTEESLTILGTRLFASISKPRDRIIRSFFMVNYTHSLHRLLRVLPLNLLWKNRHVHSSFEKEGLGQFSLPCLQDNIAP